MSLGFTLLDGVNAEGDCDTFLKINNSSSNEDVMVKYSILIDSYKNKIIPSSENDENNLTITNINFLENVLQIKTKIKSLNRDQNLILDKIMELDREINELEKIKQNSLDLNQQAKKYKNITVFDTFLNEIADILHDKKQILEENNEKLMKLVDEIKLLKSIIGVNEISPSKNSSIMCFICAEKSIEACLNPCGHTFCNSCVSKIANQRCYMCRKTVISSTKLFFDNGYTTSES
jgi:hypothetical protein